MRSEQVGLLGVGMGIGNRMPSPTSPPPTTPPIQVVGTSHHCYPSPSSTAQPFYELGEEGNESSRFRFWSALRSVMLKTWSSEKEKSRVTVEYLALDGDGESEEGRRTPTPEKRRTKRKCSLRIYGTISGLLLLALVLLLNIGETVKRWFLGGRDNSPIDYDPFSNWGKPGTGTEGLAWYPTDFLRDVLPIPAHSHNDYWRKVPLFSALYAGCTGVEADVWLRNEDLLVGHDLASLQVNRTFQSLYINPLVDILTRQNPSTPFYDGKLSGVFDTDPEQTLVLLVDLKTEGESTWPWVVKQLQPLREKDWLSYYADGKFHKRPITVVGTGNTPFDQVAAANSTAPHRRDAFFDAPLEKLENSVYDWTNSFYASVSFWRAIGATWWKGEPGSEQLDRIRKQIKEAHKRGLKSRYWETPVWPTHVRNRIWTVLVEEGVDMLNVDDLKAAQGEDWTKPGTFKWMI